MSGWRDLWLGVGVCLGGVVNASLSPPQVLSAADWRGMEAGHRARAGRYTGPCRDRRARGVPHPVEDFLFEYYPFPCSLLDHWHPGLGVALEWDEGGLRPPFSARHHTLAGGQVWADPARLERKEIERLWRMRELLDATRGRAGNFACHGLHEWAMVYRGHELRHGGVTRLRLPQAEIDRLVETRPVRCSHHDAFRFFAPAAREFNRLRPAFETRELHEQPGCIHANMDLYKWAAKSMPWIGSELLLDCFETAMALRDLDMRASPYDLSAWGLSPVRIEMPEGRAEYEAAQRALAERAAPLRDRLIGRIDAVLAAVGSESLPAEFLAKRLVK